MVAPPKPTTQRAQSARTQQTDLLTEQERERFSGKAPKAESSLVRDFAVQALINPGMLNNRPKTDVEVKRNIIAKYPSLYGALANSNLPTYEVIKGMRFAEAYDAANAIAQSGNPYRQAQIINTMGPDMQGLVSDIFRQWQKAADENAKQVSEDSTGNTVMDVGKTLWGFGPGLALDAAWKANQLAMRGVTAFAGSSGFTTMNPVEAWNATAPGQFDPGMVQTARSKFGDKTVDVILEIKRAAISGDPDTRVGELYQRYSDANDIDALAVLDEALFGINANQKTQDAITYLTSAETGNLGNLMFWSMIAPFVEADSESGVQAAQSPWYTGIRDTSNVVGTFVFDPTLVGGKVAKAYMGAKYGLRVLAVGGVDKVFQKQAVRTFFDTFGSALGKVDGAENATLKAQTLNSVRSQYKRFFDADAIQLMLNAGVRDSDTALEFFRGAKNLQLMIAGETAKRTLQVPHMLQATSQFKRASLAVRGLTYDKTAAAALDSIFGMPVSTMLPADAIPVIIQRLSEPDGDKFVGRMLSDFVFADDTARRTFLGRILDPVTLKGESRLRYERRVLGSKAMERYGFKRKGDVRSRLERTSRLMAHYPVVDDGLRVVDGRDADKVRDMLLYFGMPKYWADYGGMLWREMDEGQRVRFGASMFRSGGYALGLDIVDPVNGQTLIDNLGMGMRSAELYAPDMQDVAKLRGIVDRDVKAMMKDMAAMPGSTLQVKVAKDGTQTVAKTPESKQLYKKLFDDRFKELSAQAEIRNPSKTTNGETNALYESQMADRIAFPNLDVLDQLGMRQSYLTALIGTNPFMTAVTDWWTLGTLAGPRFAIRNGIEDAVLFAATGGNWNGFRWGMKYKNAKREATLRPEKAGSTAVRGEKLGLGITGLRYLGDVIPDRLNALILPHLSPDEIQRAATLGAEGNRSGVVNLILKALLRQKLTFIDDGKFSFLRRAKNLDDLTASQQRIVQDLNEAAEYPGFFNLMDEASESTSHLYDGRQPLLDAEYADTVINGVPMRSVTVDRTFRTLKTQKGDPKSLQAWYDNLTTILHGDAGKGQKAVGLIRRYYWAKRSNDLDKIGDIVDEFASWITDRAPWVAQRSGIAATEGVTAFARRNLDDVLRVFTTKRGSFNQELMDKITRVEVDEKTGEKFVTFALWDVGEDGKKVYRLTDADLQDIKGRPQTVLDRGDVKMIMSERTPFRSAVWNAMGRSMARLTREPIYIANYLDARNELRPMEQALAQQLGEEYAKNWAVNASYERALQMTMSYVDNPSVRSQLAWNIRNVARFYRALEDFNRRMIRVAKNEPLAFQRINLAWHVLDDTGLVQENEYGDKYFIWPTSRAAFEAINWVTKQFGVEAAGTALPMALTSNVSMLTPSADPNSWAPTFSGPYASFAVKPLMNLFPGLKSLEQELFGEYSSSQAWVNSVLPPNVLRLAEVAMGYRNGEAKNMQETQGMFASSARAAIQASVAAGLVDQTKPMSFQEKRQYLEYINTASLDIMLFRLAMGFFLPAASSVEADTVTPFARDIGVAGMREAFIQLLKANPDDPDKAYTTWLRNNPGRSIFTVSSYKDNPNIGSFRPFKETVQFIEDNKDLVDQYPVGSAFFAPQAGMQNLASWTYLRAMDVQVPKSVEQYFNEMSTSEGYALYMSWKKQYEDAVARGEGDAYKPRWEKAKEYLYNTYPELPTRLKGYGTQPDYARSVEDIRGAVKWMESNRSLDKRGKDAQQVLAYFDQAVQVLSQDSQSDPNYAANKKRIKERWRAMYEQAKTWYPNDSQWEFLLNSASGALKITVTP